MLFYCSIPVRVSSSSSTTRAFVFPVAVPCSTLWNLINAWLFVFLSLHAYCVIPFVRLRPSCSIHVSRSCMWILSVSNTGYYYLFSNLIHLISISMETSLREAWSDWTVASMLWLLVCNPQYLPITILNIACWCPLIRTMSAETRLPIYLFKVLVRVQLAHCRSTLTMVLWTVVLWTVVLWTVVLWTVVIWTVVIWTVVIWTVVIWTHVYFLSFQSFKNFKMGNKE